MQERIEELSNELLALPTLIRTAQTSILDLSNLVETSNQSIFVIESGIKTDVNNETDTNGKKSFTNSETRDLEFRLRSAANNELTGLKEYLKNTQRQINDLRHDIERDSNTQRNIRSILGIFTPAIN